MTSMRGDGRASVLREAAAPARASAGDTLRVAANVLTPLIARGVIIRRPRVVAAAERVDADRRLVRTMQRLRARYGSAPLRLRVPGRPVVLVLDASDVEDVLHRSPDPFAATTPEKRGALGHFQPRGVLLSRGEDRTDRRRFTESVLEPERPVHHLAAPMVAVVRQEAADLLAQVEPTGVLEWDRFVEAWFRVVRRVVLGDSARDDTDATALLGRLRGAANWAGVHPGRPRLRAVFLDRVRERLSRAEPGSLAAVITETPTTRRTHPADQVAHWLFAFDAGGMSGFRALALLATHPAEREAVQAELAGRDLTAPQELPALRAAVLEAVRLWPTTPAILRETTAGTELGGRTIPARSLVLVLAPFFHRDDQRLAEADRFAPHLWRDGTPPAGIVPFSAGPVICPGRSLVQFLAASFLAAVLEHHDVRLISGAPLGPDRPLPATLDPFRLRFTVTAR
jgi:cytochrome P450